MGRPLDGSQVDSHDFMLPAYGSPMGHAWVAHGSGLHVHGPPTGQTREYPVGFPWGVPWNTHGVPTGATRG